MLDAHLSRKTKAHNTNHANTNRSGANCFKVRQDRCTMIELQYELVENYHLLSISPNYNKNLAILIPLKHGNRAKLSRNNKQIRILVDLRGGGMKKVK